MSLRVMRRWWREVDMFAGDGGDPLRLREHKNPVVSQGRECRSPRHAKIKAPITLPLEGGAGFKQVSGEALSVIENMKDMQNSSP